MMNGVFICVKRRWHFGSMIGSQFTSKGDDIVVVWWVWFQQSGLKRERVFGEGVIYTGAWRVPLKWSQHKWSLLSGSFFHGCMKSFAEVVSTQVVFPEWFILPRVHEEFRWSGLNTSGLYWVVHSSSGAWRVPLKWSQHKWSLLSGSFFHGCTKSFAEVVSTQVVFSEWFILAWVHEEFCWSLEKKRGMVFGYFS